MRIRAGPLRRVRRVSLTHRNQQHLIVSVTILQRPVAVQVVSDWVTLSENEPCTVLADVRRWRAVGTMYRLSLR
jgi:hypothetical protein